MTEQHIKPDLLFEIGWEVCNKIGGIHTVISTKALTLSKVFDDNYICIGPDVLKETYENPEFIEDENLFKTWRGQAQKDNLHIRIGRWNIHGQPIVILVDFTLLFLDKDKIFADYWLKFGLNSLSGQWDYVEPAMFGYAAGQVIEHFYNYYFSSKGRFVAHFHEWMTGSGILYLKDNVPQAATLFTTHATSLGRSIASNNLPLYKELGNFNPEQKAEELGLVSKYSMEVTAANNADAFTTVSDITNLECEKLLGRKADVLAINGFENKSVPKGKLFNEKRKKAKAQLIKVAEGLINQKIPDDYAIVNHSGRYEFRNKGIDLYIDALAEVNKDPSGIKMLAFIMIPANQTGAKHEVGKRIDNPDFNNPVTGEWLTHNLADETNDAIINKLKELNLTNKPEDNVKVIFIPAYLDGNDGILNLDYYDALMGTDITVFPSYYEPWGYTPLESIAYNVPTITTGLAGFGKYVNNNMKNVEDVVCVIDRDDDNYQDAVGQTTKKLKEFVKDSKQDKPLLNKLETSSQVFVVENDNLPNSSVKNQLDSFGFSDVRKYNHKDNWIDSVSNKTGIVFINCINYTEGLNQLEFLYELKNKYPGTGIIVVTNEQKLELALEAVDKDVCFLFLKEQNIEYEIKHLLKKITNYSLYKSEHKSYIISCGFLWENLINNYYKAYDISISKVNERKELFKDKKQPVKHKEVKPKSEYSPKWKKVLIEINIPKELRGLDKISKNIWWSWNYEAVELFESIDYELWEKCEKNPVRLLENLTTEHYQRLIDNNDFMQQYKKVVKKFDNYMKEGRSKSGKQIAYFSMEYGLHESIKLYSGGLGVLAGDYLKQASDDNINMIGVGLLYRYGYFTQGLSVYGDQISNYYPHNFTYMAAVPVRNENGDWVKIRIALPGRILVAKVWKIDVGRIPLYLLDTDLPENASFDKAITHQLYGGDWENRFKQEFLLGVGGIRLLETVGINPDVYHCNEGHAAFTGLERLRKVIQENKLIFHEALEVIKASSLFTTHTPVPAGHDSFTEDMLRTYMPYYADRLGISWEAFMSLGRMHPENPDEEFSMSVLAVNLSQEINGVSKIHGGVAREMFEGLYPGYFAEELHIGHVTNGVHFSSWTSKEWQKLYEDTFGKDFYKDCSNEETWKKVYDIPDEKIWQVRNNQRVLLFDYIKKRITSNLSDRQKPPKRIYNLIDSLDENALTIGFARRFTAYKRAHLLFNDPAKLERIVNMENMPVQFIFAGKAHPADKAGQGLIKKIVEYSNKDEFKGKIIFLEDYDMELARYLVQGVDVWLNTPTRPLEASGTSGQKAVLNGVLNFSVLDGWWAEGYLPQTGWSLKEEKTYEDQALQDELDAAVIYNLLESEIIPMFFDRPDDRIPREWIKWIKNNIAKVAPRFTNKRMLDDYFEQFYSRNFDFSEKLQSNNFANAKKLSSWKNHISKSWNSAEVVSFNVLDTSDNSLLLGENFEAEITIDLKELSYGDIGMEIVFIQKSFESKDEINSIQEMEQIKKENNKVTFKIKIPVKKAGIYNYAFRMYPKHELLANRQNLPLVKWL